MFLHAFKIDKRSSLRNSKESFNHAIESPSGPGDLVIFWNLKTFSSPPREKGFALIELIFQKEIWVDQGNRVDLLVREGKSVYQSN